MASAKPARTVVEWRPHRHNHLAVELVLHEPAHEVFERVSRRNSPPAGVGLWRPVLRHYRVGVQGVGGVEDVTGWVLRFVDDQIDDERFAGFGERRAIRLLRAHESVAHE